MSFSEIENTNDNDNNIEENLTDTPINRYQSFE